MTSNIYVFLPQCDQHSFFILWTIALIQKLKDFDKNLVLCKLKGSNVDKNFAIVAEYFHLEFIDFEEDHVSDGLDVICAHVHDEFFQKWFLKTKSLRQKSITMFFYTDGSNPLIERRHLEYFRGTNLKLLEIRYIIFPASRLFHFWWSKHLNADRIIFDHVMEHSVHYSYNLLINLYKQIAESCINCLQFMNTHEQINIVMLRPFAFSANDRRNEVDIISNYLLPKLRTNQPSFIKYDSRMSLMTSREIMRSLKKYNPEIYEIDSTFNHIPIEVLLPVLATKGVKKIHFLSFCGSFIFNSFLIAPLFREISIEYGYPDEVWSNIH